MWARGRLQVGVTRPRGGRNGPRRPRLKQAPAIWSRPGVADYEDAFALKRALAGIDDSPDKTTSEGMLTLIQTVISRCTELNGACYIERKQPGD